jgi:hypothetical protein
MVKVIEIKTGQGRLSAMFAGLWIRMGIAVQDFLLTL